MLLLVPPILCCSSPMPGRREPALHSACLWEPLRLLHFLPQFCAPGLFPRSPFASHTVPPPVQEYHSNPFPPLPVLPIADDQPVPMLTGKVRVPNPSLLEALCCQTSRPGQAPWPHVCHKGGFALGSCSAGASCWVFKWCILVILGEAESSRGGEATGGVILGQKLLLWQWKLSRWGSLFFGCLKHPSRD